MSEKKKSLKPSRPWDISLDELSQAPPEVVIKHRKSKKISSGTQPKVLQKRYRQELAAIDVHCPSRALSKDEVANLKMLHAEFEGLRHKLREDARRFKTFNKRQVLFLRFYMLNGYKSLAKCMRQAGYQGEYTETLAHEGRLILRKPGAAELLSILEQEEKLKMKITIEEVVAWFQKIADAAMASGDLTNANRSMENLAKYLGMFVDKKVIEHRNITSKEQLDARIEELTTILKESDAEIAAKLRVH